MMMIMFGLHSLDLYFLQGVFFFFSSTLFLLSILLFSDNDFRSGFSFSNIVS